ncbi:transient receptor potential cation channel subfamily V member 3-like [Dendronephthya gigantea]|uniref:transient receptor potential cation channel subfamily V member 3-like n=1 Tax=Dendronephthya gigantea TaxID=151771 RepID=UPI00106D7C5A|nr:transient receptor potential cation channel subfamily V member 3-like [Dendronephthya gigantea]
MNNEDKPTRRLSRYNTRRSSIGNVHKPYEHLLLKELPGAKRSNAAMHAVLESALEDNMNDSIHEAQKVRNHALIHYLASLANSNNNDDIFDFDFVQSLIENGADVNSTDKSGQSIFHEVARSWNLDVALFLLEHGADLNQQDKFGRSPLHVAAAVDYSDMVRFLVKHGANINITTYGEEQMPIHFAAKNDACKSLKMLLGYGANIDSRDSKNRTPLQVAAEMNRAKSAKLLVQHGAPAGVHDNMGNSALSLLIEKLPDVAIEALDQFHSVSSINRKEFFFLNYLEGNRLQDPKSPAYSALEIAVQNQEFDIILHPVMKRLIDVKWQQFGRNGAVSNLGLNLLYAILWTILGVTSTTNGDELYLPWSRKAWRLVLSGVVCLMTIDEVRRQITGTLKTRNRQKKWISWRASELEEDLSFCHPRWPQEELYLKSEIKAIRDTPLISSGDSWIYFDWFSLILILGTIASHLVFVNIDSSLSQVVHARIITVLLLVLWLRIMQYARPFEGAGPFVAIFGHIINDIVNWGILTLLITIPYACAFWITFGDVSRNPVESYSDVSSLLYELFSMIVVNDHDFEALQAADAMMARLLCGSYIALMAIINLNILIALLSDTFTRVYGNAVANAVMQRAKTILFLEKSLSRKRKRSYEEFIKNFGSPESVDLARDISANTDRDEQKAAYMLRESVQEIHNLIHERFGKQYGEGKKWLEIRSHKRESGESPRRQCSRKVWL